MGEPNITDLPPTMGTDSDAGTRISNPTSVNVGARSGETVNPWHTNGYPDPSQWPTPAVSSDGYDVRKSEAM